MSRVRVPLLPLSAIAALSAALLAGAPAAAAPPLRAPALSSASLTSTVATTGTGAVQTSGEGYWTPERIHEALKAPAPEAPAGPAPVATPARATGAPGGHPPAAAAVPPTIRSSTAGGSVQFNPSRVTGKLFFTDPYGQSGPCTASALNSGSHQLVITAGHCVHGGRHKTWMQNVMFAPYYSNGVAPYGYFYAKYLTTFAGWADDSNLEYDLAMITLWDRVVDVVGGHGIIWNWPLFDAPVTVLGYPIAPKGDGATQRDCLGTTRDTFNPFDSRMEIRCYFTGGASGGPWLMFYDDAGTQLGYVNGITSTVEGDGWNKSVRFDDKVGTMYNQVANRT